MMNAFVPDLQRHLKERNLVSIWRAELVDFAVNGYVLAVSDQLLVMQFIDDFRLDGLIVLRTEDITSVACGKTNIFQKSLMQQEGIEQHVPFDTDFDAGSWRTLLSQFSARYPVVILECENYEEDAFIIGRLLKATTRQAHILGFSGAANWFANPTKLPLSDITSCQVDTSYGNMYQRHFDRVATDAATAAPDPAAAGKSR